MNRVNFLVRRLPVVRNNVRRLTTIDKTEMQNMITKSQVFVFDVRWGLSESLHFTGDPKIKHFACEGDFHIQKNIQLNV